MRDHCQLRQRPRWGFCKHCKWMRWGLGLAGAVALHPLEAWLAAQIFSGLSAQRQRFLLRMVFSRWAIFKEKSSLIALGSR